MEKSSFESQDYQRIEKSIQYIEEHFRSQPRLDEMAACVNLSRFHFERLFKRWAGISPKQFQQFLTLDYAKKRLKESHSLLATALDAGLSGTGRLHDLFVTFEAMTPGEFKKKAAGLTISYGFGSTPFGRCLLAQTERGICSFGFMAEGQEKQAVEQLRSEWPGARFREDSHAVELVIQGIFFKEHGRSDKPFHLNIKGTNFQVNVWRALLTIPPGHLTCYQDVASLLGSPKAVRAVASAIARNPVAFLIPCHRVIAKSGKIHQYRWGSLRKKALIGWEAAHGV